MISLRRLLTISYLAIILVGIAIAAPLAWLSLEQSYLANQQANVLAQAHLVAQALQSAGQPPLATTYSQLTNTLPGFHTHIIEAPDSSIALGAAQPLPGVSTTMIAEDGPVVIGLQAAPPVAQQIVAPLPSLTQNTAGHVSPQELLSRPEIASAFSGRSTTAIRTLPEGQRVLYAAAPIVSADGTITRIVYLATPLPKSGWAALAPSSRGQLLGLAIFVILVTGLLGWRFSWILAHPLGQIVSAAKRVAAGDLSSHVSTRSTISDLRLLSQAFNDMTASLQRADLMKLAFVADVSHELRTPLTVIKGTVETLQDGAVDDLEAREVFLASIADETERLIDLVNGLLTLARADGGALKIKFMPLNLTALVQARANYLQAIAVRKAIEVHVSVVGAAHPQAEPGTANGQAGCWVLADTDRITQVVDNLLDNAIRYSRNGDQVHITITPGTGQVTCSVIDTGPGIAAAHVPFLFNRFYRVEASRNRSLGGSGLGLAISRAIVEAHGGSISVQSSQGHGTTLTFTLPAAQNCS
jgi:signal transduction histidine kinase